MDSSPRFVCPEPAPTGEASPLAAQVAVGPFDPPAGYAFEPEFEPPVPRPIPPRLRQGRMEQRRTWALRGGLAFGIVCVAIEELPLIKHWGQFVLPLAYLSWIGLGIIALGALSIVIARLGLGPDRYICRGIPLVARVVELCKSPVIVHNGQAMWYAFSALVEYRDPQTGGLMRKQVKSPEFMATAASNGKGPRETPRPSHAATRLNSALLPSGDSSINAPA